MTSPDPAARSRGALRRVLAVVAGVVTGLVVLAGTVVAAFVLSVRPGARLLRRTFDAGSRATTQGLEPYLPAADAVVAQLDVTYRDGDPDGRYDVYRPVPEPTDPLPVIVWVHGGGWLAGSKENLASWARILAARGFVVVVPGYTIAPAAHYPHQLQQVLDAVAHLVANPPVGADVGRVVLAGDSAGASLVAQAATAVVDPAYREQVGVSVDVPRSSLRGLLLNCGPYDLGILDAGAGGLLGLAAQTIGWSYLGVRHYLDDPRLESLTLVDHAVAGLPPAFISGGNGDALTAGAKVYAERLTAAGNDVETLFFPDDYTEDGEMLAHEYQFNLTLSAARVNLERSIAFVHRHTGGRP